MIACASREAAVFGWALEQAHIPRGEAEPRSGRYAGCKSAAIGMGRDEHLFLRYGEWRRGKFVAGGFGAEIVRLV
jgi:hypothetical protein